MGVTEILEVLGVISLFIGVFTLLIAGIGLLRLPDLYLKASAVGTSAGLGVAAIVLGVLFLDFSLLNLFKAMLAITAQLLTSAVGSMAIARSGYLNGNLPCPQTHTDDLMKTRRDQFSS